MAGTRVIVIATQNDVRWNNYRGTSNHLVTVEKEVLLQRTVKQFLKYTDDVCIIGIDGRYNVEGATLYIPNGFNTNYKDANKFMCSQTLWNKNGRTILVFGDVYFTNEAVKTIMKTPGEFKWFIRSGASEFSGGRSKEVFAFAFDATMINNITQSLLMLISRDQVKTQSAWALYSTMTGDRIPHSFVNHHHVNIDDWTQDFDSPEDLQIWEEHRALAKAAKTKQKK